MLARAITEAVFEKLGRSDFEQLSVEELEETVTKVREVLATWIGPLVDSMEQMGFSCDDGPLDECACWRQIRGYSETEESCDSTRPDIREKARDLLADDDTDGMLNEVSKEAFTSHPFEQFIKLTTPLNSSYLIHASVTGNPLVPSPDPIHDDGKVHALTWSYGQGDNHHSMTINVAPPSDKDPIPFTTALHRLMLNLEGHIEEKKIDV